MASPPTGEPPDTSADSTPNAGDRTPIIVGQRAPTNTMCSIDETEYDRPTVVISNVETDDEWVQMPKEHTIPESEWE